jgi:hypothetical protein
VQKLYRAKVRSDKKGYMKNEPSSNLPEPDGVVTACADKIVIAWNESYRGNRMVVSMECP